MADVTFDVTIELADDPASRLRVRYFAKVVDGFLGIEQFTRVRPGLVRAIIDHARRAGWDPRAPGVYGLELVENGEGPRRPALLLLPEVRDLPGYEPKVALISLGIGRTRR